MLKSPITFIIDFWFFQEYIYLFIYFAQINFFDYLGFNLSSYLLSKFIQILGFLR